MNDRVSKCFFLILQFSIVLVLNAQHTSFSAADVNAPLEHIFINEIMANNTTIADEYEETDDWIELYNNYPFPVDIGGLYLSDDVENPTRWQLSDPLELSAGGFVVIWADNDPEQGSLHATFKLSSSGETLLLSQVVDDEVQIIDSVSFGTLPENASYGRQDDGTETWHLLSEPTPESTNNESNLYLKAPYISMPGGLYEGTQTIELIADLSEVDIFYTLNGNIPDQSSTEYTAPIQISQTSLLKVSAFKDGYSPSILVESFYLFNHQSDLPVFSISTDPDNLWDDSLGIYTKGTNGAYHHCCPEPANWFQDWERPALISMFEPDGVMTFSERAAVALGGNDSRKFVQKSLNIHFRNEYGSGGLNCEVFPDLKVTHFKHLKLRNSGQDFGSMMMRDGLNHSLLSGMIDIDLMAYRPAVVYLNGEYWGMYGLRESLTDDYIADHFNVKKADIDLIYGNGSRGWAEVESGSDTDYQDLYNFIEFNDLSSENNFNAVAGRIDINEYLNYQIAQIYYASFDWPGNNIKMWHTRTGGKWRWMMFDTDASTNFSLWGDTQSDFNTLSYVTSTTSTEWPNNRESTLFLRKLLQNDGFKYEFVQRTCTYMAVIFDSERVSGIVDSYIDLVDGEIDRQIEKWSQNYPDLGSDVTCGGSKESWLSYMEDYKDFFKERPSYMMQHMKSYFNNTSTYNLSFNYDEETDGSVYLHSNDFEIPYNYSAEYFSNYPLKIKAVADSGYLFVKWLETGETSSVIDYVGNQSATLTPLFIAESLVGFNEMISTSSQLTLHVFPNPATTENIHIHISGAKAGERLEILAFNMLGEQIRCVTLFGTSNSQSVVLSITDWKRGVYILKLQGESVHKTAKLIVQ